MAQAVPGLGSNLDVNGIVTQLMTVERRPLAALDRREASYQARLSAYGTLRGALSAFQTAMLGLANASRYQANAATSGDATLLTGSADSSATPGQYTISVSQLARAQTVMAAGVASDTAASSTGTLTVRLGTGAIKTVTLDSSNNTLRGLRDAINTANAGVSATIVNDGGATPFRLVLTAQTSGAASTIQINNNLTTGELKTALDTITVTQAALDATLSVNGVPVTSALNTVSGAISGVTLNLAKTGTTTLNVTRDRTQVQAAVQSFVKAYNDANKTLADLTAYDPATRRGGLLQGDSTANGIQARLRATLTEGLAGLDGIYTRLSQIGVSFQRDGSIALDTARLTAALDTAPTEIGGLFATQGRSDNALFSYVTSTAATRAGAYAVDITAAATQATITSTGDLAASTVIDGTNNTINLTVDGRASGAIAIAQGTYTRAQLAAALQNALDGSATLANAAASARVTLDGNRLRITSNVYGSASGITSFSGSAMAALGLNGTEGSAGTNVQGTFTLDGASITATGEGQILSAAAGSAAEGLKVRYQGTAAQVQSGTDATLRVSRGYAAALERAAGQIIASGGSISTRTDGINASVRDLGKQREAIGRRLVTVEASLRAQFTALDGLVGRLTSTGNFLQQQLRNLPGSNTGNN